MTNTQITAALVEPTELQTRYDRALYWLNEAVRVDEVMGLLNEADQLRLLGRQAKDNTLQADAAVLKMRAERKLGGMIIEAREAGLLSQGGRPTTKTGSRAEQVSQKIKLEDAGIDRKLSMKSQALAKSPEAVFEEVVRLSRDKILSGKAVVINPIKDVTKREKQLRRMAKEALLAAKGKDLPTDIYQLIYADPEWKFETFSDAGLDRGAENHYPTSDLATIKARPVGTLAAKDCVLFMWATVPMLPQALEAMRFWGFEYRSHIVWDKQEPGTGFWFRNQHEILLVGVKGNVPAPAMGTQYPSLVSTRKGPHSEKPDWAYELIEAYFPTLKKIELNARRRRQGWDAWGYEAAEDHSELAAVSHDGSQLAEVGSGDDVADTSAEVTPAGHASVTGGEGGNPDSLPAAPFPAAVEGSGPTGGSEADGGGEVDAPGDPAIAEAGTTFPASAPLSRDQAEPVLRAHYETKSAEELSIMLGGVPVPTIRTWAFRLKLTSKSRLSAMASKRNSEKGATHAVG